ncbi:MAG: M56 family metallopeptidase, partial [Planctomycetota bacterium]|nr:M56 family metallopeptidase [Planctomycetota bacterium]
MTADLLRPLATLLAHPLTESVGWSLVHFLWQGLAIACLLAAALYCLRTDSPNSRYLAGCTALLLMAASLAVTIVRTEITRPLAATTTRDVATGIGEPIAVAAEFPVPASRESGIAATDFPVPATPDEVLSPVPNHKLDKSATTTSLIADNIPFLRSLLPWIVAVWLIGVALLSTRLCAAWFAMRRLRHRGTRAVESEWQKRLAELAARVAVSRPVRLLESTLVEVPTVIGWLRPVVLLPVSALTGLSRRQLESLLAHELAHIRRHDYAVNLVQTAIETVLFYHPAVWWVSRVIRAEREVCCDDIAVAACGDRLEYARALATMEELRGVGSQLALTAAGRPLLKRVRRLVGLPTHDANRSAWWIVAATAASLLALAVFQSTHINTAVADETDGNRSVEEAEEWGEAVDGLACRLVPLSPSTDDESPDASQSVQQFTKGDDVTFAVELKNVSEKPITLLGVRYGESYAGAKGKLATSFFGPHLFEFRFTDAKGKAIPRT